MNEPETQTPDCKSACYTCQKQMIPIAFEMLWGEIKVGDDSLRMTQEEIDIAQAQLGIVFFMEAE